MVVSHAASNSSESLRLSAWLLLIGQVLYIAATRFHTGGDANDHVAVFAAYAASGSWTAVHLAQFASMAILLAGLFALSVALDAQAGSASSGGIDGSKRLGLRSSPGPMNSSSEITCA